MLHTKYQRPRPCTFRHEIFFKVFSCISLCKTCQPWGGAIFGPRVIIWTILAESTRWSYVSNIKGLGLLLSDKEIFPYMGLCKTSDPWHGAIFNPRAIKLNNFWNGPLDEATYQISKSWAFWFQTRRFFKSSVKKPVFSSCDLDVQWTRPSEQLWKRTNQGWFLWSLVKIQTVV